MLQDGSSLERYASMVINYSQGCRDSSGWSRNNLIEEESDCGLDLRGIH